MKRLGKHSFFFKLFSKSLFFFYVFFISISVMACGIQTFEPIIKLQPPMGLKAQLLTNKIMLTFWGLNDEPYFSGYNIYVTTDGPDANNSDGNFYTNDDGLEGYPTIYRDIKPVGAATLYTVILEKNYDNQDFIDGLDYFFYVKAYSIENNITSLRSNVTNVRFTNR